MLEKNTIDELGKKITQLLPESGRQLQADFEANLRALLQSSLTKMNLVTREEFDVQAALLERTREKLEQMVKQLEQMENRDGG